MASTKTITRLGDLLNVPFPTSGDNGKVLALVDYASGQHMYVAAGSQAALDAHTAQTTAAHGGIVASSDSRLTDTRVPTDGSVTNAKVAAGAGIVYSKLVLTGAIVEGDLAFAVTTQAELDAHAAAADPHPGYRLESVPITAAMVAADVATQSELDAVGVASLILAPTASARNTVTPTGAAVTPLVLVGLDSHSVPLLSLQAANVTSQARIDFPTTGSGHGTLGITTWTSPFGAGPTIDPVIAIGYNINAGSPGGRVAGEASGGWYWEGDFDDGVTSGRVMEAYVQAYNNAGDKFVRPLFFDFKRNATTKETLLQSSVMRGGTGGITFAWQRDAGDLTMATIAPNAFSIFAPNTSQNTVFALAAAATRGTIINAQYNAAQAFSIAVAAADTTEFRVGASNALVFKIDENFGAGRIQMADGAPVFLGSTTGTKFGTATTQKLAFFNSTPIVQPANTTDLRTALINLGLLATGGATPLDLNGGTLKPGRILGDIMDFYNSANAVHIFRVTSGSFEMLPITGTNGNLSLRAASGRTSQLSLGANASDAVVQMVAESVSTLTIYVGDVNALRLIDVGSVATVSFADGNNLAVGTGTGTKIGTSVSEKIAFHNAAPVVQRAGVAQVAVATTGATAVTPFGFTTAAQADALVTLTNEMRAVLVEKGLMKGAA